MTSLQGQVLDGKYAIVRRIAEGGTSTVYLGINQRIGKHVAVKVLRSIVASDPEAAARFEREARIVSRIRSAHVADVFDFGELPTGERFMVMEYLEGESLATLIQRDGTIDADKATTIALQILDALGAAHSVGVVHRDLKPENVIVSRRRGELVVKVVDFGISTLVASDIAPTSRPSSTLPSLGDGSDGDASAFSRVTVAGSVLGTPLYMSPEQARGEIGSIDSRADLYSLGVMLYEAVSGEPPHSGDDMNELLLRIALDEPEPLRARAPWVDDELCDIVERALAKEPEDRFASADEMHAAIDAWRAKDGARDRTTPSPRSGAIVPFDDVMSAAPTLPKAVRVSGMFARFGKMRRWAISALFAAVGLLGGVPALQARLSPSLTETTAAQAAVPIAPVGPAARTSSTPPEIPTLATEPVPPVCVPDMHAD